MSFDITINWEQIWEPKVTSERCMTHIGYIPDHLEKPGPNGERLQIVTFHTEADATMFLLHCITPRPTGISGWAGHQGPVGISGYSVI